MASLYLVDAFDAAPRVGDVLTVTGAEARHAVTVSRLRVGQEVRVGDGAGTIARGAAASVEAGAFTVVVDAVETAPEPPQRLVLVQALAKGGRDELAVQTATELGVDAVVPWTADRSVSRWEGAKVAKGVERWASIVREAAKQSIRPRVPAVRPLAGLRELEALAGAARMLVLEPSAQVALTSLGAGLGASAELVVGPEGGIAPRELERLVAAGATAVRLGPEVLRTSSAGPAALAAIAVLVGRW
jgi:16S rRNA (uracil1498-N3)-methyltransferase